MGIWVKDPDKKGWLTAILELGAWVGCLYSGFLAEMYAICGHCRNSDADLALFEPV